MGSVFAARDAELIDAWFARNAPGHERRLEIWPDGALSVARDFSDAPHRGFHASIKLGLTGDFEMHSAGGSQRIDAVIVAPSVEHSTDARGSVVASLLVDPESDEYGRVAHWLASANGVCVLPGHVAEPLRRKLIDHLAADEPFTVLWDSVFAELSCTPPVKRHRDARVHKVAALLKENFVEPPSAAELAAHVNLSVSRLVHLFTEGMGVSLRTYVHWLRMRDVLFAIAGGESLTLAAHRAGFADLPHLTRKFRDM
ncbi:MAG TPA: AraC family transcriptional regulator, partial [Polyangiaceae bacterium]|nr:AraC family transcriptional regulator [Polyangiaceae bacterium]